MKIRFHNAIAWMYKPLVKRLIDAGYTYGEDMQGFFPEHDAKYLLCCSEDVYSKALEIQKHLQEFASK